MVNGAPPLAGREGAARRWRIIGWCVIAIGLAGGILAAVGRLMDLPFAVGLAGIISFGIGVVGACVVTIGLGWTRGLPWSRSLWLGVKAAGSAIRDLG